VSAARSPAHCPPRRSSRTTTTPSECADQSQRALRPSRCRHTAPGWVAHVG
jgi:hypothetical protein